MHPSGLRAGAFTKVPIARKVYPPGSVPCTASYCAAHQALLFVAACFFFFFFLLELSRLHPLAINLIAALQALLRKDGAALPLSPRHPNTLSCPLVHADCSQSLKTSAQH